MTFFYERSLNLSKFSLYLWIWGQFPNTYQLYIFQTLNKFQFFWWIFIHSVYFSLFWLALWYRVYGYFITKYCCERGAWAVKGRKVQYNLPQFKKKNVLREIPSFHAFFTSFLKQLNLSLQKLEKHRILSRLFTFTNQTRIFKGICSSVRTLF